MPSNTAAWQPKPGVPFEIKDTPYTSPSANEIVVKNRALALNPIDFKLQDVALFPFLQYPIILGNDVAGEVVEVGSSVTRFKPGDRVLAFAIGATNNDSPRSGFQEYSVVPEKLTAPVPDKLSFSDAAVIPVGISTAACGLFQKGQLGLEHPSLSPKPRNRTVLIWGGSSSVGLSAIQLAVAAGYEVFATASPRNFDLLRSFGVSEVFDYNIEAKELAKKVIAAFKGKTIAGAFLTAGDGSVVVPIFAEIFAHVEGNKFLTTAVMVQEDDVPKGFKHANIFGLSLKDDEVGDAIFKDFLPQALQQGKYKAVPQAEIVGDGLESLQKGIDILRGGVSAKKLVVTLQ